MPGTISTTIYDDERAQHTVDVAAIDKHSPFTALANNIEAALGSARPRLMRLASLHGIAPDAAEDVVQETLVEAWRHLNQLHTPDRFDAWLAGICRNVCLRWMRSHTLYTLRNSPLIPHDGGERDGVVSIDTLDVPDPLALDPADLLSRQDLTTLLDHALSYLSADLRTAVELCYLAELPQREVAVRMGLTIEALESRLVRARRNLRLILSRELRADAETFGLALDANVAMGWRETREWCTACGRHRLYGRFEQDASGLRRVHFRCPGCQRFEVNNVLALSKGQYSFRPALKRVMQWASVYIIEGLASGVQRCSHCGVFRPASLLGSDELAFALPSALSALQFVFRCPACDETVNISAVVSVWSHPQVQQFMAQHPRWIHEPIALVQYAGQSAIQVNMIDITSCARLALFAHPQTFQILGTQQE
jgi:RNA polymerase sigma factor (sigma-70 family)